MSRFTAFLLYLATSIAKSFIVILYGREIEERAKLLNCEGAFRSRDGAYFETAKRVSSRDFIIDCIIENGSNVPQMDISGIL